MSSIGARIYVRVATPVSATRWAAAHNVSGYPGCDVRVRTRSTTMWTNGLRTLSSAFAMGRLNWIVLPHSNVRYQKSPSVHTAPSLAGTGPNPADGKQGHINHCGTVAHAKKTQLPALPSLPTPRPTCACSCPELPLRRSFPAHYLRHPVHTRPLPHPTRRRPPSSNARLSAGE